MDFAAETYRATPNPSGPAVRGLVDQLRRSAISVPANIAEGYGRESARSYAQFLKVARGSLNEAETHILLAARLDLIESDVARNLLASTENISKMLNGLIRSISAGHQESNSR
jgi:four helix bundle protein